MCEVFVLDFRSSSYIAFCFCNFPVISLLTSSTYIFDIYRDKTGLHDELTNWSGTSGEYNDIKREYENGPAFWRSSVAVTPEFQRGLPEVTFLIEM